MDDRAIKARIIEIIEDKDLNITSFSTHIGIAQKTFSNQVAHDTKLTVLTIQTILKFFPEISVNWLFTGEGAMYRSSDSTPVAKENKNLYTTSDFIPEYSLLPLPVYDSAYQKDDNYGDAVIEGKFKASIDITGAKDGDTMLLIHHPMEQANIAAESYLHLEPVSLYKKDGINRNRFYLIKLKEKEKATDTEYFKCIIRKIYSVHEDSHIFLKKNKEDQKDEKDEKGQRISVKKIESVSLIKGIFTYK